MRVSGYNKDYLTYGYDEFGNDLYSDLEETGIPNPYSRQGEEQPFGYTGYRYDDISGTYFAQAREYQPKNGRFTAQDVIQGNGAVPETLNRYGYCWSMPLSYVDLDGREPADIGLDLIKSSMWEIVYIIKDVKRKEYAIDITDYDVTTRTDLIEFIKYGEKFEPTLTSHGKDKNGNDIMIIEYGHNTSPTAHNDEAMYIGVTLTEEEAEKLLIQDLQEAVPTKWLSYMEEEGEGVFFTAYEIDALTSLNFTMGGGWLTVKRSPQFYGTHNAA